MRIHLHAITTCAVSLAAVALLAVEFNTPAVGIDDVGSAVGGLGISLEDLSLSHDLGQFSFLLNGGFLLLSGALACCLVSKRPREPMSRPDPLRSRDAAAST